MIIIGELINASRKAIGAAIEDQDAGAIQKVAEDQHAAGANFIDVNAGIFVDKEPQYLSWLVQTVQEVVDGPCAIDSPNPVCSCPLLSSSLRLKNRSKIRSGS